jgi:hypothetical protein
MRIPPWLPDSSGERRIDTREARMLRAEFPASVISGVPPRWTGWIAVAAAPFGLCSSTTRPEASSMHPNSFNRDVPSQ